MTPIYLFILPVEEHALQLGPKPNLINTLVKKSSPCRVVFEKKNKKKQKKKEEEEEEVSLYFVFIFYFLVVPLLFEKTPISW
jgi:hypothetical protein